MPWVTPRTWTDGETITTVIMNQHLRDELLALQTIPVCKMTQAGGAQSIPNNSVDTVVTFNTALIDTDTIADLANNRMVIKTAGKYNIGCAGGMVVGGTTGFRMSRIKITRSGVTTIIGEVRGAPSSGQSWRACGTFYDMQVNDQLQYTLAHNDSTGALNTATSPNQQLWAYRVAT
jgi:hypothetical protein